MLFEVGQKYKYGSTGMVEIIDVRSNKRYKYVVTVQNPITGTTWVVYPNWFGDRGWCLTTEEEYGLFLLNVL